MGILDLPGPLLAWLDFRLGAAVPEIARIVFWASAGAALSMLLYWLLSPQYRLERMAVQERVLRKRLSDETADVREGLTSAGRLLRLALLRLWLVLLPATAASVPVLCIMVWLETHYSYDMPKPGQPVAVRVMPPSAQGAVVAEDGAPPRVEVHDSAGGLMQSLSLGAAVPVVHKRVWWNRLIGNPLGYLPDDAAFDKIEIDLPEKHYLSSGPQWLRTWHAPFFAMLLAASLGIKLLFRIR